jgi:geranylgeranyl diphosphate synthase type 3
VYNDYVNLNSTAYIHTKGAGDDLTEGKFSLPAIRCIRTGPDYSTTMLQIRRQKTEDDGIKRYAIDCLQRAGSFIYTRRTLMELIDRARGLLADIETDQGSGSDSDIVGILDRLVANVN